MLGAGAQAPEVPPVQVDDRARGRDPEEDHRERIAESDRRDRQGDPGDDRRHRRIAGRQEDDEPDDARR